MAVLVVGWMKWHTGMRGCNKVRMQKDKTKAGAKGCLGLLVAPRRARNCRPMAAALPAAQRQVG